MSCSGNILDLCVLQGTTFEYSVLFTDDSSDLPVDISSWSGIGPIKSRYGDTGILGYFNLDFSAGQSGVLVLNMHRTGTAAVPVGQHRYEIELYPSASEAVRYMWGYAEFSPEVSS